MKKIVVNRCYGGFGLSAAGQRYYLDLKGLPCFFYKQTMYKHREGKDRYDKVEPGDSFWCYTFTVDHGGSFETFPKDGYFSDKDIDRDDKHLIETVEKLGSEASGRCAQLEIVEIPDDVEWEIDEYDGLETIREKHRSW